MKFVIRYGLAALLIITAIVLVIPHLPTSSNKVGERVNRARYWPSCGVQLTSTSRSANRLKVIMMLFIGGLREQVGERFCDDNGTLVTRKEMSKGFVFKKPVIEHCVIVKLNVGRLSLMVSSFPVVTPDERGQMVLVHDLAVVAQRTAEARRWIIVVLVGVVFLAAAFAGLVTILLTRAGSDRCGARTRPYLSAAAAASRLPEQQN